MPLLTCQLCKQTLSPTSGLVCGIPTKSSAIKILTWLESVCTADGSSLEMRSTCSHVGSPFTLTSVCSDGTVYGCGSTENGQLPYLKFTAGAAGTEPALPHSLDQDGEPSQQTRNEVTVPTKLNLQFLQQQRGNKSAVVSSMVAGSYCSALLTRAPDELPDHRHTCLADRWLSFPCHLPLYFHLWCCVVFSLQSDYLSIGLLHCALAVRLTSFTHV